jgi:hypothetical protein
MLKNLTEAVLYFATQELAGFHNKGNYRELLQSFCKLDSAFDRHLNDRLEATERPDSGGGGGGGVTGVSSDVQNDLIACLDDIIQGEIDKEISEHKHSM